MSRYSGPRVKVMRALGVDLPGLSQKSMQDRPHPPGQHGIKKVSGRKSEFGLQLMEKQKLRYNYGLTERQLRRIVSEAKRQQGATGGKIIELLERRLDNLVFRAGFAPTIPAARQLINHGHVLVNGRKLNIASAMLKPGDVVELSEKGMQMALVLEAMQSTERDVPEYVGMEGMKATYIRVPTLDEVPYPVKMEPNLVVEFYSR